MPDILKEWLLNLVSVTAILALIGYLLRDAIAKLLSKTIENRFERKLEIFKSEIRDNETELGHVDKWRSHSLMQAMSMKPRKLSAVLS